MHEHQTVLGFTAVTGPTGECSRARLPIRYMCVSDHVGPFLNIFACHIQTRQLPSNMVQIPISKTLTSTLDHAVSRNPIAVYISGYIVNPSLPTMPSSTQESRYRACRPDSTSLPESPDIGRTSTFPCHVRLPVRTFQCSMHLTYKGRRPAFLPQQKAQWSHSRVVSTLMKSRGGFVGRSWGT